MQKLNGSEELPSGRLLLVAGVILSICIVLNFVIHRAELLPKKEIVPSIISGTYSQLNGPTQLTLVKEDKELLLNGNATKLLGAHLSPASPFLSVKITKSYELKVVGLEPKHTGIYRLLPSKQTTVPVENSTK